MLAVILILCGFIVSDGWLSQYARTPTDATIAYRQEVGDIPQDLSMYEGVIAVEDCAHIGKDAYLYVAGRWRRVIVFDCLGREVQPNWMQQNNIVAEMGYYLTQELELVGQGGIPARLIIIEECVR